MQPMTLAHLADTGMAEVSLFEPKVVTATVLAANSDIATVRLPSGQEAIMPISEFQGKKRWVPGERYQVLQLDDGPCPMVSATRPELVEALFAGVCPKLRSGGVRIMGVARAAGYRCKVAVAATEESVHPVSPLIGRGANRVNAVKAALGGEQIDVVRWHADPEIYLRNALAPAVPTSIRIDGQLRVAIVSAPSHMMAAMVGASGLNALLAGRLLMLHVEVVADREESALAGKTAPPALV